MKLDKQDFFKIKIPLFILVGVLCGNIFLFFLAQNFLLSQEHALKTQQKLLSNALQHYQSSGLEKGTITEFLPLYQLLINKGFVGEERRIEWVDELRAQHKNHKLFGIKFSISQQENYKPPFGPGLGNFVMHRSVMKLDLDMLHEGDILQLTESLSENNAAPFMLRDCEITRINTGTSLSNQLIANLHAKCELDWLTLHEPVLTESKLIP